MQLVSSVVVGFVCVCVCGGGLFSGPTHANMDHAISFQISPIIVFVTCPFHVKQGCVVYRVMEEHHLTVSESVNRSNRSFKLNVGLRSVFSLSLNVLTTFRDTCVRSCCCLAIHIASYQNMLVYGVLTR